MKLKYKVLSIGLIVFLLILSIFSGYQSIIERHEFTHEAINTQFGLESKTTVNLFSGSVDYTIPEDFNREDLKIVKSLHSMNELVTYQFSTFYLLISLMMMSILLILMVIVIK